MKEIVLIPSYKPDGHLAAFLEELKKEGLNDVLIVDDGSGNEFEEIYQDIRSKYSDAVIIYHAVNLGKGRALKTGLNYALNKYDDLEGVVSCDADGQHPAYSVKKAAELIGEHPDKLILGVRRFLKAKKVPVANFLGNVITIFVFKMLTGLSFGDTQCGLRGFPKSVMEKFVKTKGERFDYENIMLLDVRAQRIDYAEFPMEAVYNQEEKQSTHFNKVKDSAMIYASILKSAVYPVITGLIAYFATVFIFANFPMCSLIKTGMFYAAGLLIGWLLLLIPVSEEKGKLYDILLPILHTVFFAVLFYRLLNYTPLNFYESWWLLAIFAAPSAYIIYLKMRYGKKPKRLKIKEDGKSEE